MTACALAMFAAILPLRYGTPQEREILFEDVCFLKTAVVERAEMATLPATRSLSFPQMTNLSAAVRASCAYFMDGARLDEMSFGVEDAWKSQAYDSRPSPAPWPTGPLTNVFGFACMTSSVPAEISREVSLDLVLRMFRDVREMRYKAQQVNAEAEGAWMEYVTEDGTLTNSTGVGLVYERQKFAALDRDWDESVQKYKWRMTGTVENFVSATRGDLAFVVPEGATRCLVLAGYFAYHTKEDADNEYLDNIDNTSKWAYAVVPFLVAASNGVARLSQDAYLDGADILSAFGFPTEPRTPSVLALSEAVDVSLEWASVYLLDMTWPTTDLSWWDWEPSPAN